MLHVSFNNFPVMSGHFLSFTSTQKRIKCVAQGRNSVTNAAVEALASDHYFSSDSNPFILTCDSHAGARLVFRSISARRDIFLYCVFDIFSFAGCIYFKFLTIIANILQI